MVHRFKINGAFTRNEETLLRDMADAEGDCLRSLGHQAAIQAYLTELEQRGQLA